MNGTQRPPWQTHDFKVKMLDWSAARGSRLAYTCRQCRRRFCCFSIAGRGTWAVDDEARALEDAVTDRWLAESCPGLSSAGDDKDRMRVHEPAA
jgi:hypothetical protein